MKIVSQFFDTIQMKYVIDQEFSNDKDLVVMFQVFGEVNDFKVNQKLDLDINIKEHSFPTEDK